MFKALRVLSVSLCESEMYCPFLTLYWEAEKPAPWWVSNVLLRKETEACKAVRKTWFILDISS